MGRIDPDTTYYVHCAAGYRSVIFISIMMSRGFTNLINVKSGFKALKSSGRFNISQYQQPVTML
jgi:rhodanese-related sulfurtransferase